MKSKDYKNVGQIPFCQEDFDDATICKILSSTPLGQFLKKMLNEQAN